MPDRAQVWQTPKARPWRALSARMNAFVDGLAGRDDIITVVKPADDAGAEHAARYLAASAELHIDANRVLEVDVTNPDTIDPNNPAHRYRWPYLMGAAAHAAAHAAHTRVTFSSTTEPQTVRWSSALEDVRVEQSLVNRVPSSRRWLRAAFTVAGPPPHDGGDDIDAAVATVVAVQGRVAAGVLDAGEVDEVLEECGEVIGAAAVDEVGDVLDATMRLHDGDLAGLLQLGRRLCELIQQCRHQALADDGDDDAPEGSGSGEDTPDEPADTDTDDTDGADSDSGPDAGDTADDSTSDGEEDAGRDDRGEASEEDASEDARGDAGGKDPAGADGTPQEGAGSGRAAEDVAVQLPCGSHTDGEVAAEDEHGDGPAADQSPAAGLEEVFAALCEAMQQSLGPVGEENLDGRFVEQAEVAEAADAAEGLVAGYGGVWAPPTMVRRKVDAALQSETRALVAAIRRAEYRGVQRTRVAASSPPGRLRTGELMQRTGQVETGLRPRARPWRQTIRRVVPRPRLTVGVSTDVSDTMQPLQRETARMTYALQQAVRMLGGSSAAVAWNSHPHLVARPGEAPATVREVACEGSSEGCPASIAALDGALGLTRAAGSVRVLVVVTDGMVPNYDAVNAKIDRLSSAGVHILWVAPYASSQLTKSATTVELQVDPYELATGQYEEVQFGAAVGQAIAALLESA